MSTGKKYRVEKDGRNPMNEYPVDTNDTMWIDLSYGDIDITDLHKRINEKWPGVDISNVSISLEYHNQYNITYDLYDSSDYVNYMVVTLN